MLLSFKKIRQKTQQGFTLVEFVVILAIFSIMAGISLFNFNGFENRITLTTLADDIALTIREAQVFGISASQQFGEVGSQIRGVHFTYDEGAGQFSSTFNIFADNGDTVYNDRDDEIIDEITINTQDKILRIEVGNDEKNLNEIAGNLDITFERPDPDATIIAEGRGLPYAQAKIVVESQDGNQRAVNIYQNGRISTSTPETDTD